MRNFDLDAWLCGILDHSDRVSDINFSVGRMPQVELDGQLIQMDLGVEKLSAYQTEAIALHILAGDAPRIRTLVETGSTDCSYEVTGRNRFRVNIFQQRTQFAIVMRVIANDVPTVEQLFLPDEINNIADLKNGIVLVTGPTGSGKSTTLAAVINKINMEKGYHIVTIEDPIEYFHPHKKGTVNQREVGVDTKTFGLALRAALRQAPKVILIGEMRDIETIEIAMEAAETGHLVLSTLHTIDAAKTIERILGVFPKEQEAFVRRRFSASFRYVVSQRLVPKVGGGRSAVLEILKSTQRTREYVLKGEQDGRSILDAMADGSLDGMQTFDQEFERLVRAGVVSIDTAMLNATNPTNLRLELADILGVSGEEAFELAEVQDFAEE
jgi:twitching motility protein PilT